MHRWFLSLLVLYTTLAFSQTAGRGIPNSYRNDPAVDLTRAGKLLLPDEVHDLRIKSKNRFDISTLDPVESSDLWKNVYLKDLPADLNPVLDMDEVQYHSPVSSPSGIFRFNIENKAGDNKLYTMMLSKNVHTVLLLKSLLRKIGYQIPDIKYLPRMVVKFKSEAQKIGFIEYLESVAMAGAAKSWIVEELEDNKLLLQDLIIMDSHHPIYNLAVDVRSDMIQNRRLLAAVAIPYAIVKYNESVNMFRWNAGVLNGDQIDLFLDSLEEFQCSWDDARWISCRIEKLTREDWEEIVESSKVPKSVQMILLEKIISRRNSIMKLFKIDAKNMKTDPNVSNGVELVKGKLTQQNWPGYSNRFAHGDPASPLASSEMAAWVKSKSLSSFMEIVLSQVNQLPFMGVDIEKVNSSHFEKEVEQLIKQSILEKR